jgi:hypothetical protein
MGKGTDMAWRGDSRRPTPAKVATFLREMTRNPLVVLGSIPGELAQRRRHQDYYSPADANASWDERLHELLGAPWPCPDREPFDEIMEDITALLAKRGLTGGRYTYAWYSDAENSLGRAAWCAAVHTGASAVVETGVAHGVTTRIVLEALARKGRGHLWSVDLPFPFDHRLHGETGVVVPETCRARWSYVEGTSRKRLPGVVKDAGEVNVFIHDSLHTARNTLFEMEQVARVMSAGGVMLVDDIKSHAGFSAFAKRHPDYSTIIAPSDDRVGMFGIAVRVAGNAGLLTAYW